MELGDQTPIKWQSITPVHFLLENPSLSVALILARSNLKKKLALSFSTYVPFLKNLAKAIDLLLIS